MGMPHLIIKPVLNYGSVMSTLTQKTEQMLCTLESKILRRVYMAQYKIKDTGILDGIV